MQVNHARTPLAPDEARRRSITYAPRVLLSARDGAYTRDSEATDEADRADNAQAAKAQAAKAKAEAAKAKAEERAGGPLVPQGARSRRALGAIVGGFDWARLVARCQDARGSSHSFDGPADRFDLDFMQRGLEPVDASAVMGAMLRPRDPGVGLLHKRCAALLLSRNPIGDGGAEAVARALPHLLALQTFEAQVIEIG